MRSTTPGAVLPEHHALFIYDDDQTLVDRMTSFLGAATEVGEAGVAVVDERKWALLRDALGRASQRVQRLDNDVLYLSPEAALATYDALLRQTLSDGAAVVRLFGELPVRATPDYTNTWGVYEAVLNRAFAQQPVSIICGYDRREHPPELIEAAWHTHAKVLAEAWEDNPRYEDPARIVGALTPVPRVLPHLRDVPLVSDPKAFRDQLRRELMAMDVAEPQSATLLAAAAEVFENAQTHGRGARSQRLGRVAERVVWELSDGGPGFDDPLAGYIPPRPGTGAGTGTGLWIARQLTHSVEFWRSPHGFTTRLSV